MAGLTFEMLLPLALAGGSALGVIGHRFCKGQAKRLAGFFNRVFPSEEEEDDGIVEEDEYDRNRSENEMRTQRWSDRDYLSETETEPSSEE